MTIPWRSWSVSLAKATSKRSRIATSGAMAYGDEQSIRILPSQSTRHEAERRIDAVVDHVPSMPYRAMIGSQ